MNTSPGIELERSFNNLVPSYIEAKGRSLYSIYKLVEESNFIHFCGGIDKDIFQKVLNIDQQSKLIKKILKIVAYLNLVLGKLLRIVLSPAIHMLCNLKRKLVAITKQISLFCSKVVVKLLGQRVTILLIECLIKLVRPNNRLVINIVNQIEVDWLLIAYQKIGILNFGDMQITGEIFALNYIAKKYIKKEKCVLFDVGANSGEYSKLLHEAFPDANIYAFEPFPMNYQSLKSNVAGYGINILRAGLGKKSAKLKMYNFANDETGELATIYKSALSDLFNAKNVVQVEVTIKTLEEFCECQKIEFIDFLKIDVEGHEVAVLQGAKTMIQNNKIDFIQFEFNEFNIISRVFLKDFYEILTGYNFYRIKKGSLIPMLEYKSINEIFKYQNILAIRKEIDREVSSS